MARTHVYLKVELDLPDPGSASDKERPERIATEICRMIGRLYGVRRAEVTSIMERDS